MDGITLEIYVSNITRETYMIDNFLNDIYWNNYLDNLITSTVSNTFSNNVSLMKQLHDNQEIICMIENKINTYVRTELIKYFSSYLDTTTDIIRIKEEYYKLINDNTIIICNQAINQLKNDNNFTVCLTELANRILNDCDNKLDCETNKNHQLRKESCDQMIEMVDSLKEEINMKNINDMSNNITVKEKQLMKYYIMTPLIAIMSICSLIISISL